MWHLSLTTRQNPSANEDDVRWLTAPGQLDLVVKSLSQCFFHNNTRCIAWKLPCRFTCNSCWERASFIHSFSTTWWHLHFFRCKCPHGNTVTGMNNVCAGGDCETAVCPLGVTEIQHIIRFRTVLHFSTF